MDPTARQLWSAYRRRRSVARRNALVEHYWPWVARQARHVARRLPPSVELDDLQAAGVFGLLTAIRRFDPRRGAAFETFAARRVQGAMLDWLRREDRMARDARAARRRRDERLPALVQRLGRPPSVAELESLADVASTPATVSLSQLASDDARGLALADPRGEDPTSPTRRRWLWETLLRGLRDRERKVMEGLYLEGLRMRDVARRLKISDSAVSQLHTRALAFLRSHLAARRDDLGL